MATSQVDLLKFIVKCGLIAFSAIFVLTIALILFFLSDKEIKYHSTTKKKIEVVEDE